MPTVPDPRVPRKTQGIIEKQNPGGIALFAALLCFIFAVVQGVDAFRIGRISAELILLGALTLVFLAAWWVARKI